MILMLWVSQYGAAAEETGFYAGFKMAWELLKNMAGGNRIKLKKG